MPGLKLLWEIQALDGQRKTLELQLRGGQATGALKSLKSEIEEARTVFNALKDDYSSLKKSLKMKELDVAAVTEQIESIGQKLYSGAISNVKEINTTSKKLDSLRDTVKRTEDEILNIMERLEAVRARLEEMSAELNKKAEDYRRLHGSYLAGQQKVKQLLAQIPAARQKLLDKIDSAIWQKYVEMKKKINDPLARVEKATCMGCRVGIPFHDMRLLKQGDDMVYCSNCGRMLYWERQQ